MTPHWRWRDVGTFVAFLTVFTSIGASVAIVSDNLFGARNYVRILMWSPAIAAFAAALLEKDQYVHSPGSSRWQLQACLLPLAYVSISYGYSG
jgi:hypothetical protein